MRVLLLGSSGFVGQNMQQADWSGHDLILHRKQDGCDLRDLPATMQLFERIKPEAVINCAAHVGSLNYVSENCASVIADNSRMLLNIYECLMHCSPAAVLVNPIANCAYPGHATLYEEDKFWDGPLHSSVEAYGCSRRLMWMLARTYARQYGLKSVSLIAPNMYGPFDSTDPNKAHALDALVSKFVKAQAQGQESVEIWGTGSPIREWLYAPDFARVTLKALQDTQSEDLGQPINVAQQFGLSVRDLVEIIQAEVGYTGQVHYNTSKQDGAPVKIMSDALFRRVFADFKFTSLRDGIKSTVSYYKSQMPY